VNAHSMKETLQQGETFPKLYLPRFEGMITLLSIILPLAGV
jgi:hypothetical protein